MAGNRFLRLKPGGDPLLTRHWLFPSRMFLSFTMTMTALTHHPAREHSSCVTFAISHFFLVSYFQNSSSGRLKWPEEHMPHDLISSSPVPHPAWQAPKASTRAAVSDCFRGDGPASTMIVGRIFSVVPLRGHAPKLVAHIMERARKKAARTQ